MILSRILSLPEVREFIKDTMPKTHTTRFQTRSLIPSLAPLESRWNRYKTLLHTPVTHSRGLVLMLLTSGSLENKRGEELRTLPDCQWNIIRPLNEWAPPGTRPPTQRRVRPLCESSISVADVQMHGDEMGHAEPR